MEIQSNLDKSIKLKNGENLIENFNIEIKSSSHGELIKTQKKLNYLALNFDPYGGTESTIEVENILKEFQLVETLSNPFEFTNKLLKLIDLTQEELKERQQ